MRVKEIPSGKILEVNDSYGSRLIEHGKAVPAGKASSSAPKKGGRKGEKADVPGGQGEI